MRPTFGRESFLDPSDPHVHEPGVPFKIVDGFAVCDPFLDRLT
jgi:hypothetical protein